MFILVGVQLTCDRRRVWSLRLTCCSHLQRRRYPGILTSCHCHRPVICHCLEQPSLSQTCHLSLYGTAHTVTDLSFVTVWNSPPDDVICLVTTSDPSRTEDLFISSVILGHCFVAIVFVAVTFTQASLKNSNVMKSLSSSSLSSSSSSS